ncbi:MFS transporter [Granulicella sp. WH15]|uniref:MFS transporter n=1 Tax=Granulicella sp. WH15 TaxID=2602070 RepID=UPI0013668DCA|nr:MFS transporter [Granulicella sp. WH15]QHN02631.1 MFS transporter [Granulicella sp. WH15]
MTSEIQNPNTQSTTPIGKVLVPVFLIVFTDIMGFGLMIPLLPFYAEHFGASAFTVGLLLSVFALCQLLAGPPLGQLSDRIGRKPVLVLSQIGTLAGYILLALSNTLWLIFLARIIDGLTAGNISVAHAYVSDNTPPEQRTKAFGIVGAAFGLGMLVGPSLGGLLVRHSLTTPIWGACVLSALSIVATTVLLPKGIRAEHKGPSKTLLPVKPILACFRDPATSGLFLLLSLFYFAFNTFISGFALFLAGRVTWGGEPIGPQTAGFMFAYVGLLGFFFQAIALGHLLRWFRERTLIFAGFLLMTIGFGALSLSHTVLVTLVFLTLSQSGAAVLRPTIMARISKRVSPQRQGLVMGVNQSVMSMAAILAPLVVGILINHGLYVGWALWMSAIAVAGAFGVSHISSMSDEPVVS